MYTKHIHLFWLHILTYTLLSCMCFSCANIYTIFDYVNDNTENIWILKEGKYVTYVLSENDNYPKREMLLRFPEIQKHVHKLVPNSNKFYNITIFIPSIKTWNTVRKTATITNNPKAFTTGKNIIIVINPNYLIKGKDKRQLQTAIHELLHHVSFELYDTMDNKHKLNEFWGSGGLLEILTNELYNGYDIVTSRFTE